jgi:peroxiredoxin
MKIATVLTGLVLAVAPMLFAVDVPRKAPEYVIHMTDGSQKLLSSFRGKVVVLEFGFTTCPHCQHASQLMSQLQREYGPKGFQALAVAFNPMAKMLVPDFVSEFKINFPVGFDEREPVNLFLQNPPESALHVPQLVFIDRKGIIRKQSLPRNDAETGAEANVRKMVEQLLAEPANVPSKGKPASHKAPRKTA